MWLQITYCCGFSDFGLRKDTLGYEATASLTAKSKHKPLFVARGVLPGTQCHGGDMECQRTVFLLLLLQTARISVEFWQSATISASKTDAQWNKVGFSCKF